MAANVCQHNLKTLPCHELKTLMHAQKFGLYPVYETDAKILQWVCLTVFLSVGYACHPCVTADLFNLSWP